MLQLRKPLWRNLHGENPFAEQRSPAVFSSSCQRLQGGKAVLRIEQGVMPALLAEPITVSVTMVGPTAGSNLAQPATWPASEITRI